MDGAANQQYAATAAPINPNRIPPYVPQRKMASADIDAAVRHTLDRIDTLITDQPGAVIEQVMNVLSALRGPDIDAMNGTIEHENAKFYTTGVIRVHALPRTYSRDGRFVVNFSGAKITETSIFAAFKLKGQHFTQHIIAAARALRIFSDDSGEF